MENTFRNSEHMQPASDARSVDKAMMMVEYIASSKSDAGVTEIAKALSLSKSYVHRVLTTMTRGGFVERDPSSRRYRVGWKLFRLALMISSQGDLISQAGPLMRSLVEATRGSASLFVLNGEEIVVSHTVQSPHPLRVAMGVGERRPFYFGAPGKILTAYLEEHQANQLIGKGMVKLTSHTISDPSEFKAHLREIRQDGFTISDEQSAPGVIGIAAPIRDYSGRVAAALALTFPKIQLPPHKLSKTVELVKRTAYEISHRIGYHRTDGTKPEMADPARATSALAKAG